MQRDPKSFHLVDRFELFIYPMKVMRTRVKRLRRNKISAKKSKMLKMSAELRDEWRRTKRPTNLLMELGDDCCTQHLNGNNVDRFLVMGVQRNGVMVPTLVLPWTKRSKVSLSSFIYIIIQSQKQPLTGLDRWVGNPQCSQSIQEIQLLRSESGIHSRQHVTSTDTVHRQWWIFWTCHRRRMMNIMKHNETMMNTCRSPKKRQEIPNV